MFEDKKLIGILAGGIVAVAAVSGYGIYRFIKHKKGIKNLEEKIVKASNEAKTDSDNIIDIEA